MNQTTDSALLDYCHVALLPQVLDCAATVDQCGVRVQERLRLSAWFPRVQGKRLKARQPGRPYRS
jgi:hypothetical protein